MTRLEINQKTRTATRNKQQENKQQETSNKKQVTRKQAKRDKQPETSNQQPEYAFHYTGKQ